MTTFSITPAAPRDLPQIQHMIRCLSAFHGDEAEVTLEQLQTFFFGDHAPTLAFVARDRREIVGYAGVQKMLQIHSGGIGFDIQHLYVAERSRAQGVGRALIAAVKAHAEEVGAKVVTIGTAPNNPTAHAAYRAMGLEEITDAGPRFRVFRDG
ncbi:GNAT family N-acetyltransferase [Cognatiyoonia sp. IB215182]|uniref:GNAT family N-acetyltransferase n=1 Tax=Cognatiyoonia sp. IB215182 TaxID=3097353 RepID=UPI002A109CF6|nr:GNAT family N-acetyltransferase [Cognatiyoonia sp. IB215182]MDX8350998.1 GNAT family N-acetyltransferase [Cognatiyoonia sp. IB215182]